MEGAEGKIDIIITFDKDGVSDHANHKSIYQGISRLMEKKMIDVEVFTLTTVHLVRKYLAIVDVNFIWTDEWQAFRFSCCDAYRTLALHAT